MTAAQNTDHLVMVRPSDFYFNTQTAVNNAFQQNLGGNPQAVQAQALAEFDGFVDELRDAGVTVSVLQDDDSVYRTPDSIFPNNWFVSLPEGVLVLCPMFAKDRRTERLKFLGGLVEAIGAERLDVADYTRFEAEGKFLEGTGAMVLDRVHKKVYACLSERCDEDLLNRFCADFGYRAVPFHGYSMNDGKPEAIYHTNVMMSVAEQYAIVDLDAITDQEERERVVGELADDGKQIIDISPGETNDFAGNELQVRNANGDLLLVMTKPTFGAMSEEQKTGLEQYNRLLVGDVDTIENYGGGSVRCMIGEIY